MMKHCYIMLIYLISFCFWIISIHGQECENEQFHCENSNPPICIRLDQKCDGIPDCPNEENIANYTAIGTI